MSDDGDSLFGSPPPSPSLRGRSPNIGLALPGTRTGISVASDPLTENVGTTALSGLHPFFDIPRSSEASSVSSVTTAWPPAHDSAPSSRSQSVRSLSGQPSQAPKKQLVRVPRQLAPPLELPEAADWSSNPHLLRSHPSLLGKAGNVARVRATHLPCPGSSADDPIVIGDDHGNPQGPAKLFQPRFAASTSVTRPSPSIPAPPAKAKDILARAAASRFAVAIKQNPQFQRILEDLNAVAAFRDDSAGQTASSSKAVRPTKKRRTARGAMPSVPAGAEDWTVPFPFKDGDIPEQYNHDWKKASVKKLLGDLINLINTTHSKISSERNTPIHLPESRVAQSASLSLAPTTPQQEPCPLSHPPLPYPQLPIDHTLHDGAFSSPAGLEGLFEALNEYGAAPAHMENTPSDLSETINSFPLTPDGLSTELFPSMIDQLFGSSLGQSLSRGSLDSMSYSSGDDDLLNYDFSNFEFDLCSTAGTEGMWPATTSSKTTNINFLSEADPNAMTLSPTSSYGLLPTPVEYTPAGTLNWEEIYQSLMHPTISDSPLIVPYTEEAFLPPMQDLAQVSLEHTPHPAIEKHLEYSTQSWMPPVKMQTIPVQAPPPVVTIPATPQPATSIIARKYAALEKAKLLREQLVREIKRTKLDLWEYSVEEGVICNIKSNL
jgi:hypothetical protein